MVHSSTFPVNPLILWSQTADHITFTVVMDKLRETKAIIHGDLFHFEVYDEDDDKTYELNFEFFDYLVGVQRKLETSRKIEWLLTKKAPQEWPRLLKTDEEVPWLTVDLNKWINTFGGGVDNEYKNSGSNENDGDNEDDANEDPFQHPMSSTTADTLESILIFKNELL